MYTNRSDVYSNIYSPPSSPMTNTSQNQDLEREFEKLKIVNNGKQYYNSTSLNTNHGMTMSDSKVSSTSAGGSNSSGNRRRRMKRPPPIPTARGSSNPNSIFNMPPKKIIKATMSYFATNPGELSFDKGDFFYVIHDKPELEQYEVMNPIEKTRGIVNYRQFKNVARNAAEEQEEQMRLNQELGPFSPPPVSASSGSSYLYDNYMDGPMSAPIMPPQNYKQFENSPPTPKIQTNAWSDDGTDFGSLARRKKESRYNSGFPLDEYYELDQSPQSLLPDTINNSANIKTGRNPTDIESCLVQSCSISGDKWYFAIHVKYYSGQLNIIRRSYDDVWALQVTLLTRFPEQSGHQEQPRSIPFLTPPHTGCTMEQSKEIKQEFNRYFSELFLLPQVITRSSYFTKFFDSKVGDLVNTAITNTDVADTLLDLMEDIQDSPDIVVKLVLRDGEIIAWKEAPGLTFDELMFQCQDRLGFHFQRLMYLDETNALTQLYCDSDLSLLVSSSPKLKFYVE